MKLLLPPQVHTVLDALRAAGFSAWAVGGCVRDSVMGRVPKDWDVTTNAVPAQMHEALAGIRIHDTGIAHGTVTAVVDALPIEITTFRVDGAYSDRRRPDSVQFTDDLLADLSRRDFTVNAMAYHPESGIVDAFGGLDDLRARRIRCVGDAGTRFGEDALRILRALRFASVLDFALDADTAAACLRSRALLNAIAPERHCKELPALLCGPRAAAVLADFAPVIFQLIPALADTQNFAQNTPWHCYDVWTHTIQSVAAAPPEPLLRMTMLLHDIAKPQCFSTDANGTAHFHGHAEQGAALAGEILTALRCPKRFTARVQLLIAHHDRRPEEMNFLAASGEVSPGNYRNPPQKRTRKDCAEYLTRRRNSCESLSALPKLLGSLGEEAYFQLLAVQRADALAKSERAKEQLPLLDEAEQHARQLLAQNACLTLKGLAVSGHDLRNAGFPPGAIIGRLLQALLDAVMRGELANEKAALLDAAKRYEEETAWRKQS